MHLASVVHIASVVHTLSVLHSASRYPGGQRGRAWMLNG